MKKFFNKLCLSVALLSIFSFGSCDLFSAYSDLPDLGINWNGITQNLQTDESKTTLSKLGWYADTNEIEAFGTVTFYNYDFQNLTAFKKVPYQFYIEYGCSYQLNEKQDPVYYDHPVYEIMLVNNADSRYYSCTYNEEFTLIYEEGEWFLTENKTEYISACLENCQDLLF